MSKNLDQTTQFLVVDDVESMRKLIIKNLSSMGYLNVFQARNGEEALRLLEQNPTINVVITDWDMPVMPGIDLLRAIRAHDKFKGLPVLMVTAETAGNQVLEAIEAGVSDFLLKPFSIGGLQSKLGKMMDNLKRGVVAGFKPPKTGKPRDGTRGAMFGEPGFQGLVITKDLQASMARQANILVVDDVADNIDVIVGILQGEYKVRAAKSGEAALKMLDGGNPPDLVLLDVMMPEMDGFEVCRRLKANQATAGIPVIFLTAADDATNVTQGFELGAVDYVVKPADPAVLKVRVRNHLTRSKAFAELQKQYQVMAENLRLREEVDRITAHDLKNPIGGIINFTDMLLADETMPQDQKELLQSVDESAHSLLNMVNLSLDLFKIEQGAYELQPSRINLGRIVRKILKEKGPEIDARKLNVTKTLRGDSSRIDGKPTFHVQGDELLCYSLIGNLIKNAVEASPNDGSLSFVYTVDHDGRGSVAITNNGTVPMEIRGRFFGKYVTSGKKGGTGLGAYSARLLAEVQQGTIDMRADDEKNETTLTLTLPLVA